MGYRTRLGSWVQLMNLEIKNLSSHSSLTIAKKQVRLRSSNGVGNPKPRGKSTE